MADISPSHFIAYLSTITSSSFCLIGGVCVCCWHAEGSSEFLLLWFSVHPCHTLLVMTYVFLSLYVMHVIVMSCGLSLS